MNWEDMNFGELEDFMMYMIGFAPRLTDGIFQEAYDDNEDRWREKTVNQLIAKCNDYYGLDIKNIEVKEE